MASRTYGQFCGLACALELIGERWALLVIRDLLIGPKRFTDLRRGLPRIPTNVLSARLKELEGAGVIQRRVLPRPAASVVYELTEYGRGLEDVVLRLGLWGAQSMTEPRDGEIVTADSMIVALRATFQPDAARGLRASYELHICDVVFHARVEDGVFQAAEGPVADADLVLEMSPMSIRGLLIGEITPRDAVQSGQVRIDGDAELLDRFVDVFRVGRGTEAVPDRLQHVEIAGGPGR